MAATATINARISESLKRQGGQVLDRYGVSTTEAVRSLYEYLAREQRVPDWMAPQTDKDKHAQRRSYVHSLPKRDLIPPHMDAKREYRLHLSEKHASEEDPS